MYKLYEITYYHKVTGYNLSHTYYIAKSIEDMRANCKAYQKYCTFLEGTVDENGIPTSEILIKEIKDMSDFVRSYASENLDDFEITLSIKKKEA